MTRQEIAAIISPAEKYVETQIRYAQDTFVTPSFKGVQGNRARQADLKLCKFEPLEELRANLSANLEFISNSLDNDQHPKDKDYAKLSDEELAEKRLGLSIGYEQIGFILSLEHASGILNDVLNSNETSIRQTHLPGVHPVHISSKIHLLEHIATMSELTGNFHLTLPELDYSKMPEINPHPSCLIGSLGQVALIHHVPKHEYGTYLHVTPVEQLAFSA